MVDLQSIITRVVAVVQQIVGIALLVLIAATVAGRFGWWLPYLPATDPQALAWLCGAWWLYRGGRG